METIRHIGWDIPPDETPISAAHAMLVDNAARFQYGISAITSLAAFRARREGMSLDKIQAAVREGESLRVDAFTYTEPDTQNLDTAYWDDYWSAFLDEADGREQRRARGEE